MANETVTISADYFAQLYKDASSRDEAVCTINALANQSDKEREEWKARIALAEKERDELKHQLEMKEEQCKECAALCAVKMQCDELKAKLDDALHMQAVANENSTEFQKRLAAAERCIEDVWNCMSPQEIREYKGEKEGGVK